MKAIKFLEANDVLGAGDNHNTNDLPIFRGKEPIHGVKTITSCFALTEEDLKEIKESSRIYLTVLGYTHPPLYISVANPVKEKWVLPIEIGLSENQIKQIALEYPFTLVAVKQVYNVLIPEHRDLDRLRNILSGITSLGVSIKDWERDYVTVNKLNKV